MNFSEKFLWGASASAHQVEGGNRNDWSEWEAHSAKFKVESSKSKVWPDYILKNYPNPLQEENYISGKACDHYHRFREDFDIAKSLGHNAHRFSIEWSRIEPEEGKFDEREIAHYREVIQALRKRGIEPFVTLWHWTLPLWLRDRGGVANKQFPFYFTRYASRMAREFPDVIYWMTLNETNVYTGYGYWRGIWPPAMRSLRKYLFANHALSQAHQKAYQAIHSVNSKSRVGIAQNMIHFTAFPAAVKNFFWNRLFLYSIKHYQDFVGANYYFSDRVSAARSDMGWGIDPEGFYQVLKQAAYFDKPIFIMENGIADARDNQRAAFIREHIKQIKKAMDEGVSVRGYFYWSLVDNFEWDKGFWPRFGLVEVDYKTLERKIRPSAYEYKKIIESGIF